MAKRKGARPSSRSRPTTRRPSPSRRPPAAGRAKAAARPAARKASRAKPRAAAGRKKSPARRQPKAARIDLSLSTIKPVLNAGLVWQIVKPRLPGEVRVPVRRPDDLLVFDLILDNLVLQPGAMPRLVRAKPGAASLIVEFPPQSFAEEAFLAVSNLGATEDQEVSSDPDYPPKNVPDTVQEPLAPMPSARARMAGPSRVAFLMPASEDGLEYSLERVLGAMREWPMRLSPLAAPEPTRRHPAALAETDFGRDWLTALTSSASWQGMADLVHSALGAAGARGVERLVAASAERIVARAVRGLTGPAADRRGLNEVLTGLLASESKAIVGRLPSLAGDGGSELVVAALSVAATSGLARDRASFDFGLSIVELLPFLPVVLSPHPPSPLVTALELPYRLVLSPLAPARWLHRDAPFESSGRVELWHTRLTTGGQDQGPDRPSKVRAIWSDDYQETEFNALLDPPLPFRMSLDALDRAMLVKLMAGFNERRGRSAYVPHASRADRLHLSALGALLDSEGNWARRPTGVDLEQWRHLASLGRDHYVRVVYAGYLCPFGHAASLIKVTERKFESLGSDIRQQRVAVLRQRFFIVCRELVREYHGQGHVHRGHNFPFSRIEMLTRVTPDLIDPTDADSKLAAATGEVIYAGAVVPRMAFWPMVPGPGTSSAVNFAFEVAATDICGGQTTFSVPLLFVGEVANDVKDEEIRHAYNLASGPTRRQASLGGATVCFAPVDPTLDGDPRLPTRDLRFTAGDLTSHFALAPNFYPEIELATVGIPPLQKLLGQAGAVVPVTYPQVYKDHGFGEQTPGANQGQVFLQLTGQVYDLGFADGPNAAKSDALGALASPQMTIQGLSRVMGPVAAKPPADPSKPAQIEAALGPAIANTFDPADFFKGATILGGVDLSTILEVVPSLLGGDVPKMLSKTTGLAVESTFSWDTPISKPDPLNLLLPNADSGKPATRLKMQARRVTPLSNAGEAVSEAEAALNNFKINLFGFIVLWFEHLNFASRPGQKPDVAVQLRDGVDAVQFGGPLEFVNALRKIIPSNGFSDPPGISVTPNGIQASYSLTLPAVEVGIFTLSGVSLGAGFSLPFDSTPAQVRFNFSEREHTFSLTVSMLGGGGFFAIGVSARGVTEIEAALEFGAAVAINLGVASGGVEIKAGIYFHWLEPIPDKGSIDLAGYVRLHGELSVLGLISASLTFNLQLGYHKESGKSMVWGEATLVIEVEVLLVSVDVSIRCRREFGGGDADPRFVDLIPDQSTWAEYCHAFAGEAA